MAAALPSRPPPRQNLDGVVIDISSRRPHRVHVHQLARDRPRSPEIAISPRDEGRVGGGGAALAPHASPKPRRRDDRHQLTQIPSSPCPTSRSRSSAIAEIAISPRDEGRVGGGGAASAPHASPEPGRRDNRHQLTQTTSSPCPTSRSRSPEITELAISSRDEGE